MDWLLQVEIAIILFFQNLGSWLEVPMQGFTFLGNEYFFLLFMPALYWSIDPEIGFRAGMMLVISGGLNSCLKLIFHTPRPFWVDSRVQALSSETSFGLPSGHAQNSTAIWGMVGSTIKRKWATILTLLVIFFVGLSRLFLGVHFIRDVVGGWLVGGLIVLIYLKLEKPVGKWLGAKKLSIQLMVTFLFAMLLLLLGVMSLFISNSKPIPQVWMDLALASGADSPDPFNLEGVITIAGVGFGFTAGYAWWRNRFGVPVVNSTPIKRLARYTLGLLGIVALYFGLKFIFPEDPVILGAIFRFIRYALIGLWVTAIAPLFFKKLGLE